MSSRVMDVSFVDLTQSSHRKATLKSCLQNATILEEEDHDNVETINKTHQILTQLETVINQGTSINFGDSYVGSQVLHTASSIAIRCAGAANVNLNEYEQHDLANHISLNPDFWEFKLPYEAPPVTYLHGTFDPTPTAQRPRAPRKRVERQAAAAMSVPDNVVSIDQSTNITEMVNKIYRYLARACRSGSLCYFKVALDPTSFGKTVENMYYLSFLAKEGLLEIYIDDQTGLPHIKTRPPAEQTGDDKTHFIASINIKLWKELLKTFKIKKPMMVLEDLKDQKKNL